jgi:hypothetical protein
MVLIPLSYNVYLTLFSNECIDLNILDPEEFPPMISIPFICERDRFGFQMQDLAAKRKVSITTEKKCSNGR